MNNRFPRISYKTCTSHLASYGLRNVPTIISHISLKKKNKNYVYEIHRRRLSKNPSDHALIHNIETCVS